MDSNIWGPPAWLFLHTITLNYPDNPTLEDKDNFRIFFNSLKNVLPCDKCKDHYAQNIIETPIQLDSKKDLVKWLIEIHNKVNELNNKPILTYDQVVNEYLNIYDKKKINFNKYFLFVIIIIFFLLVLYATTKKNSSS